MRPLAWDFLGQLEGGFSVKPVKQVSQHSKCSLHHSVLAWCCLLDPFSKLQTLVKAPRGGCGNSLLFLAVQGWEWGEEEGEDFLRHSQGLTAQQSCSFFVSHLTELESVCLFLSLCAGTRQQLRTGFLSTLGLFILNISPLIHHQVQVWETFPCFPFPYSDSWPAFPWGHKVAIKLFLLGGQGSEDTPIVLG